MKFTKEYLQQLLEFNPVEGCFYWKISPTNSVKIGDKFGHLNTTSGYVEGRIDNKLYTVHRLVWFYSYGYFPKYLDHVDTDRANNRLSNLRECLPQQNSFNAKLSKANKSGVKGLFYNRQQRTYVATVKVHNKSYSKRYTRVEEGDMVVIEAAKLWLTNTRNLLHGEFANHG